MDFTSPTNSNRSDQLTALQRLSMELAERIAVVAAAESLSPPPPQQQQQTHQHYAGGDREEEVEEEEGGGAAEFGSCLSPTNNDSTSTNPSARKQQQQRGGLVNIPTSARSPSALSPRHVHTGHQPLSAGGGGDSPSNNQPPTAAPSASIPVPIPRPSGMASSSSGIVAGSAGFPPSRPPATPRSSHEGTVAAASAGVGGSNQQHRSRSAGRRSASTNTNTSGAATTTPSVASRPTRTSEMREARQREQRAAEEAERAARLEGIRAAIALQQHGALRLAERARRDGGHSSAQRRKEEGQQQRQERPGSSTRTASPSVPISITSSIATSRASSRTGREEDGRRSTSSRRPSPSPLRSAAQHHAAGKSAGGPPMLRTSQRSASAQRRAAYERSRGEGAEEEAEAGEGVGGRVRSNSHHTTGLNTSHPYPSSTSHNASRVGATSSTCATPTPEGAAKHSQPFDAKSRNLPATFGDAPSLQSLLLQQQQQREALKQQRSASARREGNTSSSTTAAARGGGGAPSSSSSAPPAVSPEEFRRYKAVMEGAVVRMRAQLEEQRATINQLESACKRHATEAVKWRVERKGLREAIAGERDKAARLEHGLAGQNDALSNGLSRLSAALAAKDEDIKGLVADRERLLEGLTATQRERAQLQLQQDRYGQHYAQTQTLMQQLQQSLLLSTAHSPQQQASSGGSAAVQSDLGPIKRVVSEKGLGLGGLQRTATTGGNVPPPPLSAVGAGPASGASLEQHQASMLMLSAAVQGQQRDALLGHYHPRPSVGAMVQTEVTAVRGFRSSVLCREGLSGASVGSQTAFVDESFTHAQRGGPLSSASSSLAMEPPSEHLVMVESLSAEVRLLQARVTHAAKAVDAAEEKVKASTAQREASHRAELRAAEELTRCERLLASERLAADDREAELRARMAELRAQLEAADRSKRALESADGPVARAHRDATTIQMLESQNKELEVQLRALLKEGDESRAQHESAKEDNARLMAQLREAIGHLAEVGEKEKERRAASVTLGSTVTSRATPSPSSPPHGSGGGAGLLAASSSSYLHAVPSASLTSRFEASGLATTNASSGGAVATGSGIPVGLTPTAATTTAFGGASSGAMGGCSTSSHYPYQGDGSVATVVSGNGSGIGVLEGGLAPAAVGAAMMMGSVVTCGSDGTFDCLSPATVGDPPQPAVAAPQHRGDDAYHHRPLPASAAVADQRHYAHTDDDAVPQHHHYTNGGNAYAAAVDDYAVASPLPNAPPEALKEKKEKSKRDKADKKEKKDKHHHHHSSAATARSDVSSSFQGLVVAGTDGVEEESFANYGLGPSSAPAVASFAFHTTSVNTSTVDDYGGDTHAAKEKKSKRDKAEKKEKRDKSDKKDKRGGSAAAAAAALDTTAPLVPAAGLDTTCGDGGAADDDFDAWMQQGSRFRLGSSSQPAVTEEAEGGAGEYEE